MIDDNDCRKEAWASRLTIVAGFLVGDVDGLLLCNRSRKDGSKGASLGELLAELQGSVIGRRPGPLVSRMWLGFLLAALTSNLVRIEAETQVLGSSWLSFKA
ncbi:hypothetical protein M0R45_017666 [Rubus argutus]|uniref:Uncharacterized protein n=1 Tax=Rubus argutus TaxID=59490 RepID=A0AAW1XW60_RUBAR